MKWVRVTIVTLCAVIITALGIDAADTLRGNEGTMLSQVISKNEQRCPSGMHEVGIVGTLTCVDIYEASASEVCPVRNPDQLVGTQHNIDTPACKALSVSGVFPWRFITRDQAMHMCARSGKRLPTSEEWYLLSLGMANVEQRCNIDSMEVAHSGAYESCVTSQGTFDLVGNVWEWVSDDVINGMHNMRALPQSGYVAQVDAQGVAVAVSDTPQDLFEKDYFWSRNEGVFGMIRGGYYDSGTDAGVYTIHADTAPTSASLGIGFRCVQ